MDSELTDALWCAYDNAVGIADRKSLADYHRPGLLAVARVAMERAAAHLRAEAAETMAGLKTCEDRATSHMVIGLLRSMADEVEGLLPVEGM